MSLMNRSALNSVRGSIGMGQGNIRNSDVRSKAMANQSGNSVTQNAWDNPGLPVSPFTPPTSGGTLQPAAGTPFGGAAPMPQINNTPSSRLGYRVQSQQKPIPGWKNGNSANPYSVGSRAAPIVDLTQRGGGGGVVIPPDPPEYPLPPAAVNTSYKMPNFTGGY